VELRNAEKGTRNKEQGKRKKEKGKGKKEKGKRKSVVVSAPLPLRSTTGYEHISVKYMC
jgi:hypothetical protein